MRETLHGNWREKVKIPEQERKGDRDELVERMGRGRRKGYGEDARRMNVQPI